MGKRIAKASKVPLVIRSVRLGRVAFHRLFDCFVCFTEDHKDEEDAPIWEPLIAIGPSTTSVFFHILAYTRSIAFHN